ncbi:MAG: YDG domain-containing protein, partial [Clostridiales Family XIII bacterium]|nr:YDG domain-containing protein [Clostridiales Family XIII bacterium]
MSERLRGNEGKSYGYSKSLDPRHKPGNDGIRGLRMAVIQKGWAQKTVAFALTALMAFMLVLPSAATWADEEASGDGSWIAGTSPAMTSGAVEGAGDGSGDGAGDGAGASDGWITGTSPVMTWPDGSTGDATGADGGSGDGATSDAVSGDGAGASDGWIAGTSPAMTSGAVEGTDGTMDDASGADADASTSDSGISALSLTPGWNGSYTAPEGPGVVATIMVASDATATSKGMVKSSQWSTDGLTWSSDTLNLEPDRTYFIYTPLAGMDNGVYSVLPNIKAAVTIDMDPAITDAGDYFLYDYANNCDLLTSLTVPDTSNLTTVGAHFMNYFANNCRGLTYLSVPDTSHITSTGEDFLYGYAVNCSSLTSLAAPDISGITQPANYFLSAFANGCSSLTSLDVPDTSHVMAVGNFFMGNYAGGCTSLTSLEAPDTSNISSVGSDFLESYASGCSSLTYLGVPDTSHITYGNYFMSGYAYNCSSLTTLDVPDTSNFITAGEYFLAQYARGCSSLTSLDAPDTSNLTSVGNYFLDSYAMGCTSLKSLGIASTRRIVSSSFGQSRGYFMFYYAYGCSALDYLIMDTAPGFYTTHNVSWQVPAAAASDANGLWAVVPEASLADWRALTASGKTLATNNITEEAKVVSVTSTLTPDEYNPVLNDPSWGIAYVYGSVVTTWTNPSGTNGLLEALDKAGASDANHPYVILIGAEFTMGASYDLAGKSVSLRKTTGSAVDLVNHTGEQPWNYSNAYGNTAAASPDLYDGVSDWSIKSASGARHFLISGSGAASLTTENIMLDGGIDFDNTTTAGGGIQITATGAVTLRANVMNAHATSQVGGAGISIEGVGNVTVKGGVIARNRQYSGSGSSGAGGIGAKYDTSTGTILNLTGYTIIENNKTPSYGGGVYLYSAGTCTFDGNVLIRNNEACNGGGIFVRDKINLTIKGNVTVSGNKALGEPISGSAAMYSGTGGGALFCGFSDATVTIADNATFDSNTAARGGGAIYFNAIDKGSDLTYQGVTLNLTGGRFTNNQALGTYRDLAEGAPAEVAYAIGGGGAIFTRYPQTIKIPAYSTTYFGGNLGTFSAFIDNTELQTAESDLHSQSFFSGDTYTNHILNAEIHTSLVNKPGPTGYDYYNLYNNYDIGMPNNLTLGLFTPVNVTTLPADGSGGSVTGDPNNVYIDPLDTGVKQAALNSKLKFTPEPADGWRLYSFTAQTDPALTPDELTAAWTNNGSVYTLTVPGSDTNLVATFHRNAVLTAPPVVFERNFAGALFMIPPRINIMLYNSAPNDGYSDEATNITASLIGEDAEAFALVDGDTVVQPGTTTTSYQVQPNGRSYFQTARTYTATVRITYNDGEKPDARLDIPVSIEITNAGDLYLPGAEAGSYDFGTTLLDAGSYEQAPAAKNITIQSVGGQSAPNATNVSLSLANQKKNSATAGTYFTLTGSTVSTITGSPAGSDTNYQVVPVDGLAAGDYTADLVLTYTINTEQVSKTITGAVHFKVQNPASLTIKDLATGNASADIDFGILNQGYAADALSFKYIVLQNGGDASASITNVTLTGDGAGSFVLSGPTYSSGAAIGTVPAAGSNGNSWSIIPRQGLSGGTYNVTVNVTYKTGLTSGENQTATASGIATFTVDGAPRVRWYTVASQTFYWADEDFGPVTTEPHLQGIPRNEKLYLCFSEPIDTLVGTVTLRPKDGSTPVVLNISDGVWNDLNVNAWGLSWPGDAANTEGYISYSGLKPDMSYDVEVTGVRDVVVPATGTNVEHGGNTMTDVFTFNVATEHPTIAGSVSVVGDPVYGNTLSVDLSQLSSEVPVAGYGTIRYIWKKDGNDVWGNNIPTYTLGEDDVGHDFSIAVATDYTTGWLESARTEDVVARPISILVNTADKHYDGTNVATMTSITLQPQGDGVGLLAADAADVQIVTGSAVFPTIGSADADTTGQTVTFTGFDITGAKAKNYVLTGQPESKTASILMGFEAVKDVHYQLPYLRENGWAIHSMQVIPYMPSYPDQVSDYRVSESSAADGSWGWDIEYSGGDMRMGNTGTFYVKNMVTGEISRKVKLTFGVDNTMPRGTITMHSNNFTTFLNTVTFGLFFKNTVDVTITAADDQSSLGTGTDANSGIAKIEYIAYDKEITSVYLSGLHDYIQINGKTVTDADWTQGSSFSLPAGFTGEVFARITDNVGNVQYINTGGVVIYEDSVASGSLSYTKTSLADKSASLALNGNTIKSVSVDAMALAAGTDYVLADGTITFKGSFLDTLAAGNYTVRIVVNPQGEEFVAENGTDNDAVGADENDAPADISIPLTVSKAAPTLTWPTVGQITYGTLLSDVPLTGGSGSGGGQFSWQAGANTLYPTVSNTGYVLTFTPANPDAYDYTQVSGYDAATQTVKKTMSLTVKPRKLTGDTDIITVPNIVNGFTAIDKPYDGSVAASVTFTPNNLVPCDTLGTVVGQITAHFDGDANSDNGKGVVIDSIQLLSGNYTAPELPTTLTASIHKASAVAGKSVHVQAREHEAATIVVDLNQLLPTVPDGLTLGAVTYETDPAVGAAVLTNGATLTAEGSSLTLKIASTATQGQQASVAVAIEAQNFEHTVGTLYVDIIGNVPLITAQPAGNTETVYAGKPYTLSLTAQSSASMEVRWYKKEGENLTALSDWTSIGSGTKTATFAAITTAVGEADYVAEVRNASGTSTSQTAHVQVTGRTYTATVSPLSIDFGTVSYGYSTIGWQGVAVSNTGNQTLDMAPLWDEGNYTKSPYFEIATGDTTPLHALTTGKTAVLNIRPRAGLSAGTHTDHLTVSWGDYGADGTESILMTQVVTITFTVQAAAGELVISDPDASQDVIYTGKEIKPGVAQNDSGGALTWYTRSAGVSDAGDVSPADGIDDSYTAGLPVSAGSYEVFAVAAASDNYLAETSNHVTFTVKPRTLTVAVTVPDKDYDGTNYAAVTCAVLTGLADGDEPGTDVILGLGALTFNSAGTPDASADKAGRFASAGDPSVDSKLAVSFPGGFSITGGKAANYTLAQPSVQAIIRAGFAAVADTHYVLSTPNSAGWVTSAFTVTAKSGYQVGLTAQAPSPDGTGTWTDAGTALTLSSADTASGSGSFYIREVATGKISRVALVTWKLDTAAPTGSVTLRGNSFTTFLNNISFGLFFKNTVDVNISASDVTAGVDSSKTEYYLSSSPLDKDSTNWNALDWTAGNKVSIQPGFKGVVYARIYDYAGNSTLLSSGGLVVYTDSSTVKTQLSYTRTTKEAQSFDVTLSGNTIDEVYLFATGSVPVWTADMTAASGYLATLTKDADYTVTVNEGVATIELKGAWLDSLSAGDSAAAASKSYVLAVTLNPQSAAFTAENGGDVNSAGSDENDVPAVIALGLTSSKQTPAITDIAAEGVTYGQRLASSVITGGVTAPGDAVPANGTFAWKDASIIPGYDALDAAGAKVSGGDS